MSASNPQKTWQELFAEAIDTIGQAGVARRLNLSPSTISMISNGKYPAATDNIAEAVRMTFGDPQPPPVPEGYRRNPKGHLVPIGDISDVDQCRDQLCLGIADAAWSLHHLMVAAKKEWLEDIAAHIQLAAEKYGQDIAGKSGTAPLLSFDGLYRIERQYSKVLVTNERVAVAKELIERYVSSTSDTMSQPQKNLLRSAMRIDDKGNISASALLSLARGIKSDSPDWQAAVAAINDSITTEYGDPYVRVYVRDANGNYNQIPLDFPAV